MYMINLWPLLLPVAAASGWLLGKKPEKRISFNKVNLPKEYYAGLNYLLNEQPDRAVDVFLKLVEIDIETVETHLALGTLFRKRGEIDRATRIHQNLIARPQLTAEQRVSALIALGRDYMSAGVFDRAERIFNEVVSLGGDHSEAGLRYLLDIYQQEKSWQSAINIAERLKSERYPIANDLIAHFYCELAEIAIVENEPVEAQRYLKKALQLDPVALRGNILLGRLELQRGAYNQAIKYFQKGIKSNPDFLAEILPEVKQAYVAMNREAVFYQYLLEVIQEHQDPKLIASYAEHLASTSGISHAKQYLVQQLKVHASVKGIYELVNYFIKSELNQLDLMTIKQILAMMLNEKYQYRCKSCGFSGKKIHWQCPGCRNWSTVRPISE